MSQTSSAGAFRRCSASCSPLRFVLLAPTLHLPFCSLESDVIKAISRHRSSQGMTFTVDERLGYLLSPALAAYEAERVQGAPYCTRTPPRSSPAHARPRYGNAEFQSSIRRFVPEGHTFKAFPFSAIYSNAGQLLEQCLLSAVGRDILATPGGGDLARFGVRLMVKVTHALPMVMAMHAPHTLARRATLKTVYASGSWWPSCASIRGIK
jgi:hypothetical protein